MDFGEFEEFVMPEGDINEAAYKNQPKAVSTLSGEDLDQEQDKKRTPG